MTTLSLSANDIAFNMIPLAPFVQNTWTDRSVMDQVQAIAVILGNSYNFNTTAQVFLQNGQLTGTCGASTPATISLADIGNAIAEPVNVSIVLNSPTTMLSAGTFGANFCQTDIDQFSCQLAPQRALPFPTTPSWRCRNTRPRRRSGAGRWLPKTARALRWETR